MAVRRRRRRPPLFPAALPLRPLPELADADSVGGCGWGAAASPAVHRNPPPAARALRTARRDNGRPAVALPPLPPPHRARARARATPRPDFFWFFARRRAVAGHGGRRRVVHRHLPWTGGRRGWWPPPSRHGTFFSVGDPSPGSGERGGGAGSGQVVGEGRPAAGVPLHPGAFAPRGCAVTGVAGRSRSKKQTRNLPSDSTVQTLWHSSPQSVCIRYTYPGSS